MTLTKARTILENKSDYTVQEVKDAKKMIRELNKGGDMKKEVPVIAISVGMGKMKKPKKKGPMQMAMGGMANGKKHMYLFNGGAVKDNAGLRALRASGPKGMEAYNKITKKA